MKRFILLMGLIAGMGAVLFAQQLTVVVRGFETSGGLSQDEGNAITDLFISELGSTGKVIVVDRNSFEAIVAEMKFGASSWSDNNNVARLGKALNASHIIQGTVTSLGGRIVITVRVLNISTVQFIASPNLQLANMNEIFTKLTPFVRDLVLTLTNSYQVGKVGPSGGYVFYDKGSYSGGWRYLEAAPASSEFNIRSFSSSSEIDVRIGTLNINRLTGWRLPTPNELNLMYGNLKQWHLGDFRDDWYYSSSKSDHSYSFYSDYRSFQNFSDGRQVNSEPRNEIYYFRAVRAF